MEAFGGSQLVKIQKPEESRIVSVTTECCFESLGSVVSISSQEVWNAQPKSVQSKAEWKQSASVPTCLRGITSHWAIDQSVIGLKKERREEKNYFKR